MRYKYKSILIYLMVLLGIMFFEVNASNNAKNIKQLNYVEGEILIKFKKGLSDSIKANTFLQNKLVTKKNFKNFSIQLVILPKTQSVQNTIAFMKEDDNIEYIEPNYLWKISEIPNEALFDSMWGLRNIGQNGGTYDADIDADDAWNFTKGDTTVVVGIIDTGVDYTHEDLINNMWRNQGEIPGNNIDDDANGVIDDIYGFNAVNGSGDPIDDNDHGTHIAGTIGAEGNNGIGVVGVNWKAKIMALKFLRADGMGGTSDALECIDYILTMKNRGVNIKVTSNSWGSGPYSSALYDAITALKNNDILFAAAAGNSSKNNDIYPTYPANYLLDNIIAVTATDNNDELASFSSYGKTSVDVGAPGVNILSTVSSLIMPSGITYNGAYKLIYLGFGYEGINGETSRLNVMQKALNFYGLGTTGYILLVDDDGGNNYESYYVNALNNLGFSNYSIITVNSGESGPNYSTMAGYDLVIWFTGDDYITTLTNTDQLNLITFLNDNGNLFITGQNIGYDIGGTSFYSNYLRAKYIKDKVSTYNFKGVNIFSDELLDLSIGTGDGANNQNYIDVISTLNQSSVAFNSIIYPYDSKNGTSMATPHVSGLAALLWNYRPDLNYTEIKNAILTTVDTIPSLTDKTLTGGRINANNAILSILVPNSPPVAEAGSTQKWGNEYLSLSFDGSQSYDPDGTIVSYLWDFGDSTAIQDGIEVDHVYVKTGIYTATLTVIDNKGGSAADTILVTINKYQIRVNCGGGWYNDTNGNGWQSDKKFDTSNPFSWGYIGGRWCKTTDPIANTDDDLLYQRWRLGHSSYKFNVPNGIYEVTLKFAELFWNSSGKRIFDVNLEGNLVLNDFDIYTESGHDSAGSDKIFTITVTDGIIEIDFIPIRNVTAINGIFIKKM